MNMQDQLIVLLEIGLAMLLGGLIGLERELKQKPAGLRTHMLSSGSASLFVILGNAIVAQSEFPAFVQADPIRIIQAVIVGISFVGAGTILHREFGGKVEGLTTAASLLAASGIGIAVALRFFFIASGMTGLILVVNRAMALLEKRVLGTYDEGV